MFHFLSEATSKVPGFTRRSEKICTSVAHRFPGLTSRMDQPIGKTGTATNLSGSLKFQSCQFIHPTALRYAGLNVTHYIPPTC